VSGRPATSSAPGRVLAGSANATLSVALERALGETGALGATVKQLANRIERGEEAVASELGRLSRSGSVTRMGRGLWVWHNFTELTGGAEFSDPRMFLTRFRRETGVTLGQYAGSITFRSNESRPIHRWWPYVQGYSADFVAGVLADADLRPGATVLDPFAGSGTTLVEARRAGFRAWGTEILAPAALAARVKTHFELDGRALGRAAGRVLAHARRRRGGALPFLRETRRQFSARALHELTGLRDALPPEGNPEADALRLAFGKILIPSSRLHRSPCLGYRRGRVAEDAVGPYARFSAAISEMRADLERMADENGRWGPPAAVVQLDARTAHWPAGSVDLAITSPPYVNGMDYVMNYKVDLAWLGYARSYADLAALRAAEVSCDNLPRSETSAYLGTGQSFDPWLDELLPRIRDNVARKGSYRRDDMHAIVHRYFADLQPVLAGVFQALRPGGRFVIVVGDSLLAGAYIPGDLILARMGRQIGYKLRSVEIARTRRSGQRRTFMLRESVVTLERPHT
jgi:DNA modification methylase